MKAGWLCLVVAGCVAGCAQYHAIPLQKSAQAALASPSPAHLKAAARRLHGPPLPPLRINFQKPLTGAELGVISVLANPALRALRARERVARAQVFSAGLLPDPVVNLSARDPYGLGSAGRVAGLRGGFLWDLSKLVTRAATVRGARWHARSVNAQVAWREWVQANATRMAAVHLYWLRRERALAVSVLPLLRQARTKLARDERAGLVSAARFTFWQSTALRMEERVLRLARATETARLTLNADLGLAPSAHPLLASPRSYPPPRQTAPALFREACARRLDLAAMKAAYHSADQAVLQAVLNQYPQLALGLLGERNTSGITSAGVQISLVFPIFNGNRGQIAIARARRTAAFRLYVARLARARTQIYVLRARVVALHREARTVRRRDQHLLGLLKQTHAAYSQRALGLLRNLRTHITAVPVLLRGFAIEDAYAEDRIALQTAVGRPWRS